MDRIPCSNCGVVGEGQYCSACGSVLRTQMPTVREFGAEFRTEVLGFHRRALLTLATAIARPGVITDANREGRGSRFVSPIKLYLAVSAVFFTSAAVTGQVQFTGSGVEDVRPDIALAATLPVLAFWFKLFYGWIGGGTVRFSECLSFVITFQSALFTIWLPGVWLSSFIGGQPAARIFGVSLLAYATWHIWRGAKLLWNERGVLAPIRAAGIMIFYFVSMIFAAMLLAEMPSL